MRRVGVNFSLRKLDLELIEGVMKREIRDMSNRFLQLAASCRRADDDPEVHPREQSDTRQWQTLSQRGKTEAFSSIAMQRSSLRRQVCLDISLLWQSSNRFPDNCLTHLNCHHRVSFQPDSLMFVSHIGLLKDSELAAFTDDTHKAMI